MTLKDPNRKRICFVVTDAISFNILCHLQFEFYRQHADVELTFICGGTPEELRKLQDRNIGIVKNFGFVRRPSFFNDLLSIFKLLFFFLCNRFDLVVYSTPKALLLASMASFLTGQRSRIAIIRGRIYENYKGSARWFWLSLDRLSCFLSHKVVFISASLRDAYVIEKIVSPKKAFVIGAGSSNGVDANKFKPRYLSPIRKVKCEQDVVFRDDDFVVVIVGRLCVDKGVEHLYDVISLVKSPRVKFLIVGQVEDAMASKVVNKLVSDFSSVTYLNHMSDICSVYSVADIHLFLSHREGFGNVAIEAAASGVPTVSFDVIGVKDSIFNGVSGIRFPFGDTKSIAGFIDGNSFDRMHFSKKFLGGREWVVNNFDQKLVWSGYLNFYLNNC